MSTERVRTYLEELQPDLVKLRRKLHQTPELGLDLPQTQRAILDELTGLDLEITTGKALTSVVAVLRGKAPIPDGTRRPVVLLRGDMDALPEAEETGLDFASTNGAMHACGHDLHVTLIVAAAKALALHADELAADVVFMFQPGEEGSSGAKIMIDEGVLDAAGQRVDAAYAIHVFSGLLPSGHFACRPGAIMSASDNLRVTIRGRGGHGSAPELASDPVPAMCQMVLGTQTLLGRHFGAFDPAVISVGKVQAGDAINIIPDAAHFEATLRSYSKTAQDKLFELLPQMIQGVAHAHGVTADIDMERMYPPTTNAAEADVRVAEAVTELFGSDRMIRLENPLTASEDFSFVLQEVPGAFIGLSAVPEGVDLASCAYNHSQNAIFDDSVLADGATLLAHLAMTAEPIVTEK